MEAAAAAEQQKQQQQTLMPEKSPQQPAATNSNPKQVVIKHRRRRTKNKLNGDAIHELQIDVKRPNSVLVDTSIRALLTNYAFSQLSTENQKILIESLPLVDRPSAVDNERIELNPSSINNEFFNRACIEWRDRLAYGEFTNEHQSKLKAEQEREKSKIDPWKARNFEGIWGIKTPSPCVNVKDNNNLSEIIEKSAMEVKGRMEQGDFEIPEGFIDDIHWKNDDDDAEEVKHDEVKVDEEMMDDDDEDEEEEDEEDDNESYKIMMPSPSQHQSVSTSVPTPPETVTSTQPDMSDSPDRKSPLPQVQKSPSPDLSTPIIAEATSSADDVDIPPITGSPEPSNFIADDDDDIASHVELSSDGMPTQWYHQHEHDYLKNMPEMEPESSGMDEIVDDTAGIELIENDNAIESVINESYATPSPHIITNARITNYDAELPQEIFHKSEVVPQVTATATTATYSSSNSVMINNYVEEQQQQQQPVVVVENPTRYNQVVMQQQQEEQNDNNYHDTYMMEEADIDAGNAFHDEIHVNMPKNVKLLAFPSGVNYINNDKYIIEEQQQHIPQQSTTSTFRANGASIQPIQNSYFVGGTNTFTYISKMGNKIETAEPTTRILKSETGGNQGQQQVKQRIIYEISTEPKVSYEQPTHQITYTPPQPEIYHKMVNHNGTTTIYTESTGPPQKKTIIQRKKQPNDPYTTVQVALQSVANNNTIILTPIGNATTQQVQQQPQKSIVHIHRAPQIMQTASPPVQFLTASPSQTTFLKKQTVIIPQMTSTATLKTTPKYTTVIRAPAPPIVQQQQPQQPQQLQQPTQSKIQRPIQKQKVIMSTSSLQHYRSFNQKPNAHGSRKQLHPQHIIRPAPSATTTVIHHSMSGDGKSNQIPVILPSNGTETFAQIPSNQVVSASPTVVTINSAPTKSIFVRQQQRPQQIFQSTHTQQIFTTQQPSQQQQQQQQQQIQQIQHQQQSTIMQQIQNANQISLQPRMRTINTQRPPPGTVNLERSYQICQAVIQNSPNRHQLNCQLKPPPTNLLGGQKKF